MLECYLTLIKTEAAEGGRGLCGVVYGLPPEVVAGKDVGSEVD